MNDSEPGNDVRIKQKLIPKLSNTNLSFFAVLSLEGENMFPYTTKPTFSDPPVKSIKIS